MNDAERRLYDMMGRVRGVGEENVADFPANSVGGKSFAAVGIVVDEIAESSAAQVSGASEGKHGTALKAVARENLREDLRAINRTARALAFEIDGLEENFRMPRGDNDQNLLALARAFASHAAPLENRFVEYGLPADFLEDLNADIIAFENAAGGKNSALGKQVTATAEIDEKLERGMIHVRKLKAIVSNIYRNNPARLAAWMSASHVERASKKSGANQNEPL